MMLPPVQRIPNFMKFKENLLHGCCNISIFLPRQRNIHCPAYTQDAVW